MRLRAALLSLLGHAAMLGLIGWHRFAHPPTEWQILAPLGTVFEQEPSHQSRTTRNSAPALKSQGPGSSAAPPTTAGKAPGKSGKPSGEAQPIGEIRPAYPALSRKLGEEGEAVFSLRIAPSGEVVEATLEKSSGHDRLDSAAQKALQGAHFAAGSEGGIALKRFRVEFKLSTPQ